MAYDVVATIQEGIRVARSCERVFSLRDPVVTAMGTCRGILELAPELEPEVRAISDRLEEIVGHVDAAISVLTAKLDLATSPDDSH